MTIEKIDGNDNPDVIENDEQASESSGLEKYEAILFHENGEINMSAVIYLVAFFLSETTGLSMETIIIKLEANRDQIEKSYEKILDQIVTAIDARIKAEKASFWTKFAMWAAAAIAVVAAVAIFVCTLGAGAAASAALIAAIPAILGAIIAMGCATVEELGYMDEVIGGFAEIFKAMGCNDQLATILGAVLFAILLAAFTISAGYASFSLMGSVASTATNAGTTAANAGTTAANAGTAAANSARMAGQLIDISLSAMEIIVDVCGAIAGIVASCYTFEALTAGSKETEYEGKLILHKEENEELTDRMEDENSNMDTNYELVGRMQKNYAASKEKSISYI